MTIAEWSSEYFGVEQRRDGAKCKVNMNVQAGFSNFNRKGMCMSIWDRS